MDEKFETGELRFSANGKRIVRRTYLEEQKGLPPSSLWANVEETGHTRGAKVTLKQVFGEDYTTDLFATPKPVQVIQKVLALATDKDSIILDSFSGSGTTAHAVLEANKRDGGNRRFILVEMEEYADKLTAERVRRVINGYWPIANDDDWRNGRMCLGANGGHSCSATSTYRGLILQSERNVAGGRGIPVNNHPFELRT
jgi:adenine-specific DNA-methyltransferase